MIYVQTTKCCKIIFSLNLSCTVVCISLLVMHQAQTHWIFSHCLQITKITQVLVQNSYPSSVLILHVATKNYLIISMNLYLIAPFPLLMASFCLPFLYSFLPYYLLSHSSFAVFVTHSAPSIFSLTPFILVPFFLLFHPYACLSAHPFVHPSICPSFQAFSQMGVQASFLFFICCLINCSFEQAL